MEFDLLHLRVLKSIEPLRQGLWGYNAYKWSSNFISCPDPRLDQRFDRSSLREFCRANRREPLMASWAILAWGKMNPQFGRSLYQFRQAWLPTVKNIIAGDLTRKEAFDAFHSLRKANKLPGMGPAYFSKLITFLNPELHAYIFDQWTGKSVQLLSKDPQIVLTKDGYVSDLNTGDEYEWFCQFIETLAAELGHSANEVGEMLFSKGGRNRAAWRAYVLDHF